MCATSCDIPSHIRCIGTIEMLGAPKSIIARTRCIRWIYLDILLHELCVANLVFHCCIDIDLIFLYSDSQQSLLILVRSSGAEYRPALPFVPVPPISPFPAPFCQTSHAVLGLGLAMGTNSQVGSGAGSTWNQTMAIGLTTRKTRTVANRPVLPNQKPDLWGMGWFYHQNPAVQVHNFRSN